MKTTEELRAYFAQDAFAMALGIEIEKVDTGGAVCALQLQGGHKNALGWAQGGVLYTLADFTFAVAAHAGAASVVTLNSNINYLKGAKAGRITATAVQKSRTRVLCVYEVALRDETEKLLALATLTGYIRQE